MKSILKIYLLIVLFTTTSLFAKYDISEVWSLDLRSQIKIECSDYTNACFDICKDQKSCILKNSTCKDCISTGVKMNYLFTSFGKDIKNAEEVSIYEFVDFILNEPFIAFSSSTIYNQFDSVQSDAIVERFKGMCPNQYKSPVAFFKIENRVLDLSNARFVTCGHLIFRLVVGTDLLN